MPNNVCTCMKFYKHTNVPRTFVSVSMPLVGDILPAATISVFTLKSLYDDTAGTAVTGVNGTVSVSLAGCTESVDCDEDEAVVGGGGRSAAPSPIAVKAQ